jgi:hypothetical protein
MNAVRQAIVLMCAALVIVAGCAGTEAPKIKVGLGEAVITPPMNDVPMRGYAARNSTGVHDDLYARSLVIEGEDGTSAVLMTLALCNLNAEFCGNIRAGITEKTGIPGEHIVISFTHTHSGPHVERAGEEYGAFLLERAVGCAVDAWNSRIPGRIGTGATVVMGLGMNDRRMLHGGMHPDPEVGVIKVEDAKGKLIGVAFNYGCHPSTLDLHNLLFTEDWPSYSITGLKKALGDDVWVAYYQSAQGDAKVGYTAELSAVGAYMHGLRTFEYAEYKGGLMVEPVLAALDSITTVGDPVIAVEKHAMELPLRDSYPVTVEEALINQKQAREKLAEMEKNADSFGKRVLDFQRVEVFLADQMVGGAQRLERNPNPEPLRDVWQQAVRIGDAVFVTFPNEVFTEIGKAVKDRSPWEKTFVIGLAGGHGGYIPTAEEYLEGGYAANGTGFSPKCEQVLIEYSLDIIRRAVQ